MLEEALLLKGEAFAARVAGGEAHTVDAEELKRIIASRRIKGIVSAEHDQLVSAICGFLDEGAGVIQAHLRRLADAYTLFAFLRQTPDVQKAVTKIFSEGEIWIDTSAILPLLVETLIESGGVRRYTSLLRAVINAGIKLYVTRGVVEEIDSHLTNALKCSRTAPAAWHSRTPYVYSEYLSAGYDRHKFVSWLENFRGAVRPIDDIVEYLKEDFSIELRNLDTEAASAPDDFRHAAERYWQDVHDRRRNKINSRQGAMMDPDTVRRLVDHDVECSVGVVTLRGASSQTELGYKQWWLSLDRAAPGFAKSMQEEVKDWTGSSPVLNPDFLTEYLRIGPIRSAVESDLRVSIPVLADIARKKTISSQLVEIADRVRMESQGLPERIVRRKVRDALDAARTQLGIPTEAALSEYDAELVAPAVP